jgi:LDH2 family malate/lactate/ureidoglycolate dehydrogenase
MTVVTDPTSTYSARITALEERLPEILQRTGVPPQHARRIVEVLLDCELRGHGDHGIMRFDTVVGWFTRAGLNPSPDVRVVRETKTSVLLDGDRGIGVIAATEAMERCIAKAREHGFASAGVRNSSHFIAAGPYALMAAGAGMIGFAATNTVAGIAPTGGLTATFGTNPLAYAIPAGRAFPMLLDISTSATAAAKVQMAAQVGQQLPPGLIEDAEGRPSTDPRDVRERGGRILPMAGHKGYGLAMVVDVLCGVLTGSGFARSANWQKDGKGWGQFFWALDVEEYLPRDEFLARMDEQIQQVKASERKAGVDEIVIPGERGLRRKQQLLERGTVPLSLAAWRAVEKECANSGLTPPPVTEEVFAS